MIDDRYKQNRVAAQRLQTSDTAKKTDLSDIFSPLIYIKMKGNATSYTALPVMDYFSVT